MNVAIQKNKNVDVAWYHLTNEIMDTKILNKYNKIRRLWGINLYDVNKFRTIAHRAKISSVVMLSEIFLRK